MMTWRIVFLGLVFSSLLSFFFPRSAAPRLPFQREIKKKKNSFYKEDIKSRVRVCFYCNYLQFREGFWGDFVGDNCSPRKLISMGNDEVVTPSKSDKASSPGQEQPIAQPYPDWAAMQAYYAPGVPIPPPYFNGTVAAGHPSQPYMWGPQPLMSPFGMPYAAIYPHGVYPHPSMVSPSTPDVPAKSSKSKERGLMKKLKGFDGLAVSIGNVNAEITAADGSGQSQSEENGAGGSSDASDGNNQSGGKENRRKRTSEDTNNLGDRKAGDPNATPKGTLVSSSSITCKPLCPLPVSSQLKAGVHPEPWTQEERELKRERRKQSNRESARRSRLRKQAETEELAMKVESLNAENATLRSELNRIKESSEKLRVENSSLLGKMKNGQDVSPDKLENQDAPSVVVENFLSRIDELRRDENRENANGGKLHQLLDSNPRTDAVVAG